MNFRRIFILAAMTFAAAVWWLWQSSSPLTESAAVTPAAVTMPKPAMPQAATAPILKPVPLLAPAPTPRSAPVEPAVKTDPRKEINTALASVMDRIQSGDLVGVLENFSAPDSLARLTPEGKASIEDALPAHEGKPEIQIWLAVLQDMQSQTPVYNGAGDQATYEIADPTGRGLTLRPMTLQKIDGQWYFTVTGILRGIAGFGLANDPPTPF